jgi:hypothetical protein
MILCFKVRDRAGLKTEEGGAGPESICTELSMKLFGSMKRALPVRTSAISFALRKLSSAAPAIVDVVGGRNLDGLDITPRCAQVLLEMIWTK